MKKDGCKRMTEVELTHDINVKLIRAMASDDMVVQAAQVSVKGENNPKTVPERLINYLMNSRHGSPFEHNAFTFFAEAPIFVFREWHRHRIASINEMSGRYTKLLPKFYTPASDRKLRNVGTSARPEFEPGTYEQIVHMSISDKRIAQACWDEYETRIALGIANEMARTCLPVSVYSQMYWTVNARSLMNFLSLRIDSEDSVVRSRPQWEIQMAADVVEKAFAEKMPVTHQAFVRNGRVAP
jgi:thymidylate synthase (FAD)